MERIRCKHFSVEAEEIPVPGAPVVMRVPKHRCALAERMIGYISQTTNGGEIVRKRNIDTIQRPVEAVAESALTVTAAIKPVEVRICAACGPDLEAIHHLGCTVQRCQESCTPAYKLLLQHFELDELAEQETGVGCYSVNESGII